MATISLDEPQIETPGRTPLMTELDPDRLTEEGLASDTARTDGRMLLIGCGALAREILALKAANGWEGMDLTCLPAKLHNTPQFITAAVAEKIRAGREAGYAKIFVVYADCGTGGDLQRLCEEEGVEIVAGPHCYAFYDGLEAFAEHSQNEMRAFYLTDFLARQFDTIIWKGMGLDRHPELLGMYFGNYRKVIYLAQTDDPDLTEAARRGAERLGLEFERRFTGYGDLAAALAGAAE